MSFSFLLRYKYPREHSRRESFLLEGRRLIVLEVPLHNQVNQLLLGLCFGVCGEAKSWVSHFTPKVRTGPKAPVDMPIP